MMEKNREIPELLQRTLRFDEFLPVPETDRKFRARIKGPPKIRQITMAINFLLHCALTYYFWLRQARAIFVNDTPSLVHDILFLILVLSTVWY